MLTALSRRDLLAKAQRIGASNLMRYLHNVGSPEDTVAEEEAATSFEELYRQHPSSLATKGMNIKARVYPATHGFAFYDLGLKRPIRVKPLGKNTAVVEEETVVKMVDPKEDRIAVNGRTLGVGDGLEHTIRVLEGAAKFGWLVQGRLLNRLPHGFAVSYGNLVMFLPASQLVKDRRSGDDLLEDYYEMMAGHKIWVKVLKAIREQDGRANVVVSHSQVDAKVREFPYKDPYEDSAPTLSPTSAGSVADAPNKNKERYQGSWY